MKKLLAILLITFIFPASITLVLAEGSKALSSYTDSEILTLLDKVQDEIVDRRIAKTALLTAGSYVGGRDIPAGTYTLATAGTEDQSGIVSLRSVNDPEKSYPSKLYEFKDGDEDYSVYITIEDGDTLVLPFPYTLTISGGIMFK